ncbi:glycine-rich domain-containing protein [Lysinibacillus fusiformis]
MPEQLPEWNATGVEPPQSLKDSGWQPGMKPSAQHMNWLLNRAFKCIEELQQAGGNVADLTQTVENLEETVDSLEQTVNSNSLKIDNHIKDDSGHVRYYGGANGTNALLITHVTLPVETVGSLFRPKIGHAVRFSVNSANTGNVTIAFSDTKNTTSYYPLLNTDNSQILPGQLGNGSLVTIAFNGTNFFLQGSGSGVVTRNNASYNTAGTYELTVPKGVSKITAYIFGAGGGGGCYSAAINRGGGGGAGGAYLLASINVTPGQKLTIVVGKCGSGSGDVSQPGLSGGYSYVRSNGVDFIAGGGSGNSGGSNLSGLGGEGGVYNKTYVPPGGSYDNKDGTLYSFAANGLTNLSERLVSFGGGDGAYFTNSSDGGGGGGAASDLSGGKKGSFSYGGAYGPYATNIYGGPGGAGAIYSASAKPGNAPGGGGGGGGYVNNGYVGGANGADGRVMLYW